MKILFINPNSSDAITELLAKEVKNYENVGLIIEVKKCKNSPKEIAGGYDDLIAGVNVIEMLKREKDYDAAVIGCVGDPGLDAARTMIDKPVVGLFESDYTMAKFNGSRYSIVTSGNWEEISAWHLELRKKGESENIASIRYIDSTVEGTLKESNEKIAEEVLRCKKIDGADAVILGCSAFAGRGKKLSEMTGIPVIDGIKESIYLAKMLVEYNKQ